MQIYKTLTRLSTPQAMKGVMQGRGAADVHARLTGEVQLEGL